MQMVHMCARLLMAVAVAGALSQPRVTTNSPLGSRCLRTSTAGGLEESIVYQEENFQLYFKEFKTEFNRQYADSKEEANRYEIFAKKLRTINRLNQESAGVTTFRINQFADRTLEEMTALSGFRASTVDENFVSWNDDGITVGEEENFDWRDEGVVTRVKDQGACSSCWAFSAIGSVESQYAIKSQVKPPLEFSEQQLVDCDKQSNGCSGGIVDTAFASIEDYGGINTENDYPYTAKDGNCKEIKNHLKATTNSSGTIHLPNEASYLKALKHYGPFSISLCSKADSFSSYHGGILLAKHCCEYVNHAVLLVGYGTKNGTKYWIIKNSWGPKWGLKGYIFVERDNNACNLGKYGVIPDVVAL